MTKAHVRPRSTALRAAIYCRISADREGRELGVARQEEDSRALAERRRAVVVQVYIDNDLSASARSRKPRPQYKQMLTDARAGKFDVIIAYTSGRVTRRPREHEDLIELAERHGIEFWYVSSPSFDLNTSAGRRIARILAANDAGEAEDIQERVVRQRVQAAKLGEWAGGRRPFGWEADGVTVRRAEAREVLNASKSVLVGGSIRGITQDWNTRGIQTSASSKWHGREVVRVLVRPRNAGLSIYRGEVVGKGRWEAIVPEEIWRAVVTILSDPSRRTTPGPARRWVGSGLYRCYCGEVVRVHSPSKSQRSAHPSYTCEARHVYKTARDVDQIVKGVVLGRLGREDAAELLAVDAGDDVGEAIEQAAVARAQLDELALMFARKQITASQLATGSAELVAQAEAAEARVAAASQMSVLDGLIGVTSEEWDALALERRRRAIDRLFTVELWKGTRGRPKGWKPGEPYLDAQTVKILWREGAA